MWDRESSSSADRWILLLIAVTALAAFLSYWDYGMNDDEGYLLGGVTRILDGQVPYRDFHHTYAPGRFYLVAALFRLAGENLLTLRALWLVMRVAIVILAWFAARPFLSRWGAGAFAVMLIVAPGPWHKSFFHFFLLANVVTLGRMADPRASARRAVEAGIVAGVTLLFRQDLGAATFAAGGVLVLLKRWTGVSARQGALFFSPPPSPFCPPRSTSC